MTPDPSQRESEESDPGLDIELLRRRRDRVLSIAAVVLVLAVSLVIAWRVMRPQPVDRQALVFAAQAAVRDAIGEGYVSSFSSPSEYHFAEEDADHYRLKSEVLAVTPQGAATHYWFDCLLMRLPDGSWAPAQLTLQVQ
jgi:hypothetical protein